MQVDNFCTSIEGARVHRGDIVRVIVLDHAQGDKELFHAEAIGRVVAFDKDSLTLRSWGHARNKAKLNHNTEQMCLIRSAIREVAVLWRDVLTEGDVE